MRAGALEVLHFLDEHAENEERWVLSVLEMKVPGSADHDHEAHATIDAELGQFRTTLDSVAAMPPSSDRRTAGENLYHQYNRFLSRYLLHMEDEECNTTELLYACCTDEEILGMTANIMAHSRPDDLEMGLRAFIPAIDKKLRIDFMTSVAYSAPPEVLEWTLGIARETLVEWEYAYMMEELSATM